MDKLNKPPDCVLGYDAGLNLASGDQNIAFGTQALGELYMSQHITEPEPPECPTPEYLSKSRWWCRRCKKLDVCKTKG